MKYPKKKGMLKYVLVIIAVVFVYFVVSKIDEGFQTASTVYLYFDTDPTKKPKFISSTDPRVRYISSAVESVTIQLDPSLGTLKKFHGDVWSPKNNKWVRTNLLDRNISSSLTFETNGVRILTESALAVHKNIASNIKLPKPVAAISGNITIKQFGRPTLDYVAPTKNTQTAGDPANNNAKYRIELTFL
jgi:hypothetical protein